jgi:hypothetical protein
MTDMKGEKKKRERKCHESVIEGVYMVKAHYTHVWKCHNETH